MFDFDSVHPWWHIHPLHSFYRLGKYRQKRGKTYVFSSYSHSFLRPVCVLAHVNAYSCSRHDHRHCYRVRWIDSLPRGMAHKASELRHYKHICASATHHSLKLSTPFSERRLNFSHFLLISGVFSPPCLQRAPMEFWWTMLNNTSIAGYVSEE